MLSEPGSVAATARTAPARPATPASLKRSLVAGTEDEILGNVDYETATNPSAKVDYKSGTDDAALDWTGEHSVAQFTRMSIFDSPSVSYHVDEALEYVCVPAALALFNDVSGAIRGVQASINQATAADRRRERGRWPQVSSRGRS